MKLTYEDFEAAITKAMDKGYEIGFKDGYLTCVRHIKKQCEIKLMEVETHSQSSTNQITIFNEETDES